MKKKPQGTDQNATVFLLKTLRSHFVKSVCIQSYSGPYFPAFGLNTEYLSLFSPNAGKHGPE